MLFLYGNQSLENISFCTFTKLYKCKEVEYDHSGDRRVWLTITQTIMFRLLMKWLRGSNLSQLYISRVLVSEVKAKQVGKATCLCF